MILSHRAPFSVSISSYRAIWTHFRSKSMISGNLIFKNYISELQTSVHLSPQPSGKRKTWCQETLCYLSQGTGWYLATWSCLCSAVLRHGGGGCLSTALAKYHPVPWLRWHNVSWHQVFRRPEGRGDRCPEILNSDMYFLNIKFMKVIEFCMKWVHMARYELILKLDGAIWLRIISKPLLAQSWPIKHKTWPKNLKTGRGRAGILEALSNN